MSNSRNHNPGAVVAAVSASEPRAKSGDMPAATDASIRHLYVHIPFCARICPYCAFYKDLLDRSQTWRFCEAILRELDQTRRSFVISPETIYFGGGTPTALTTAQLELRQAEESFRSLRAAGFSNINVDLMFGLPGQTIDQWKATLGTSVALQPEHVSAYCLTYEEDTEFFVRHASGEFRQDADGDAEFFDMAMSILENAGYEHYEISNYARPGFSSVHNRAYWLGEDYLGIGPSAVSTVGTRRWQNVCDYRIYIDRVLSAQSPRGPGETLTDEMKRMERIALTLRTRDGVSASDLKHFAPQTNEFIALDLLRESNGNFVLTRKGKALADSVAEAFL